MAASTRYLMYAVSGEQLRQGTFMLHWKRELRRKVRADMALYPAARPARICRRRVSNRLRYIVVEWLARRSDVGTTPHQNV